MTAETPPFSALAADVAARAAAVDAGAGVADETMCALGAGRLLAPLVPPAYGGPGLTHRELGELGELCEAVGAACTNTRSLLTVQSMVAATITRWGSEAQRKRWLPQLTTGQVIAGLCLTEPGAGSDGAAVAARLDPCDRGWLLSGEKRWISFGQVADLLLVIARAPAGPTTVVVDDTSTVQRTPRPASLGLRGARIADLAFDGVFVPADALLGRPGFGFSHVAQAALGNGRFTVAWGCTGMIRACLDASLAHASQRVQFGRPLIEHQLVRRMVAGMAAGHATARALCREAALAHEQQSPRAAPTTWLAKYVATRGAAAAASDAVQIHGSAGCEGGTVAERMYRDSKVMQIIEGSDQMAELAISAAALQERRAREQA